MKNIMYFFILINIYRLKEESIKNIDEIKNIDSNQVKILQEQNINLTKQVQNIQLKLDELKEFKKNEQTSPKIMDNSLQRIESSMVNENVLYILKLYLLFIHQKQ